ncbi:hypothetical protein AB433_13465 [Croceicoccus naphthovorans]|uniref:Uncharacterized protein n=1 Tax=Croceicoccus naphthovorans TaxID=1348774 RepID=A0A0G3XHR9_9SPHN|nr:hypothetical protein AB433_13465 [Croceicoccus naphthovorans]
MINHANQLGARVTEASPAEMREVVEVLKLNVIIHRNRVTASICRPALLQRANIDADDGHRIPIEIPCTFET